MDSMSKDPLVDSIQEAGYSLASLPRSSTFPDTRSLPALPVSPPAAQHDSTELETKALLPQESLPSVRESHVSHVTAAKESSLSSSFAGVNLLKDVKTPNRSSRRRQGTESPTKPSTILSPVPKHSSISPLLSHNPSPPASPRGPRTSLGSVNLNDVSFGYEDAGFGDITIDSIPLSTPLRIGRATLDVPSSTRSSRMSLAASSRSSSGSSLHRIAESVEVRDPPEKQNVKQGLTRTTSRHFASGSSLASLAESAEDEHHLRPPAQRQASPRKFRDMASALDRSMSVSELLASPRPSRLDKSLSVHELLGQGEATFLNALPVPEDGEISFNVDERPHSPFVPPRPALAHGLPLPPGATPSMRARKTHRKSLSQGAVTDSDVFQWAQAKASPALPLPPRKLAPAPPARSHMRASSITALPRSSATPSISRARPAMTPATTRMTSRVDLGSPVRGSRLGVPPSRLASATPARSHVLPPTPSTRLPSTGRLAPTTPSISGRMRTPCESSSIRKASTPSAGSGPIQSRYELGTPRTVASVSRAASTLAAESSPRKAARALSSRPANTRAPALASSSFAVASRLNSQGLPAFSGERPMRPAGQGGSVGRFKPVAPVVPETKRVSRLGLPLPGAGPERERAAKASLPARTLAKASGTTGRLRVGSTPASVVSRGNVGRAPPARGGE